MAGKLYGVGVGPGDPGLLTLKAIQVMEACDVIAAPGKEPDKTVAYQVKKESCRWSPNTGRVSGSGKDGSISDPWRSYGLLYLHLSAQYCEGSGI